MPDLTANAIEVIGLRQKYGRHVALEGITLSIPRGQVICVIGPNGAGKSTLLHLLSGIQYPSAGHVKVFGLDRWLNNHELRKHSIFVPDRPVVGETPTPYAYLRFLGRIYGLTKTPFTERIKRLATQMDFTQHLHKMWRELSLGLAKKALLIGGFLPDVQLRIMDEPFAGGIDPVGMEILYEWIRAGCARGETIVFSTQVLEQAESVCDQIALLHEGRINHFGTPHELMAAAGVDPTTPRPLNRTFMLLTGAVRHEEPIALGTGDGPK